MRAKAARGCALCRSQAEAAAACSRGCQGAQALHLLPRPAPAVFLTSLRQGQGHPRWVCAALLALTMLRLPSSCSHDVRVHRHNLASARCTYCVKRFHMQRSKCRGGELVTVPPSTSTSALDMRSNIRSRRGQGIQGPYFVYGQSCSGQALVRMWNRLVSTESSTESELQGADPQRVCLCNLTATRHIYTEKQRLQSRDNILGMAYAGVRRRKQSCKKTCKVSA
eukprot:364972-Chlamydomonas_euryale.AAC.2